MKKSIILVALFWVCAASTKSTESTDLSLNVQGIYQLTFLQINRQYVIPLTYQWVQETAL